MAKTSIKNITPQKCQNRKIDGFEMLHTIK